MEKAKTNNIINDIPKGLIGWYTFETVKYALYIGEASESLYKEIKSRNSCADQISVNALFTMDESCINRRYDFIFISHSFEEERDILSIISFVYDKLLDSNGRIFIAMNNRLGIKYLCGDRDPYTERNYDGIEDYRRAYSNAADNFNGRCYSQNDMKDILFQAGVPETSIKFYSVYPCIDEPTFLYADGYVPNEDLSNRIHPSYNYPQTIFLDEELIYNDLVKNDLFHKMANAYLLEIVKNAELTNVLHVTNSIERGNKDALYTIIRSDGKVIKKAVYVEGNTRLIDLDRNAGLLKKRGIDVVEGVLKEGELFSYEMPFIDEMTTQKYIKDLAILGKKEEIIDILERFVELIYKSSELASAKEIEEWKKSYWEKQIEKRKERAKKLNKEYKQDIEENFFNFDLGPVFKNAFIDMVPLNSFYVDGKILFYDQEFCMDICPAKVIIYRMIATMYSADAFLKNVFSMDELLTHFGVWENRDRWCFLEWDWLGALWNLDELSDYHKSRQKNWQLIGSNRQRMNYSSEDFQRLFVNIFENADTRKVILFGSGNFTKKFLKLYRNDLNIYRILDNSESKWGSELDGIPIMKPESILEFSPSEYKLIICIKNYISVMKQLDGMGVKGYSIYDGDKTYPKIASRVVTLPTNKENNKKYNVGYIAGVFDLFHIGHLNLLRRAKEQCNYLIVGVVSDEGVVKNKRTNPYVPFGERLEIVKACKYVDEAVEIPHGYSDTEDAYNLYHFDVQFSGSDYAEDKEWLAKKKFLNDKGSDLVFFPYTQSTSSTKRKKELSNDKLGEDKVKI